MSLHLNSFSLCVPTLSGKRTENFMSWLRASSMRRFILKSTEAKAVRDFVRTLSEVIYTGRKSHASLRSSAGEHSDVISGSLTPAVWKITFRWYWGIPKKNVSIFLLLVQRLRKPNMDKLWVWTVRKNSSLEQGEKWMCSISNPKSKNLCWFFSRPLRWNETELRKLGSNTLHYFCTLLFRHTHSCLHITGAKSELYILYEHAANVFVGPNCRQ